MLNRSIAPSQHPIDSISLVSPRAITFENGLQVFVFHAPEQSLVRAEFIFNNSFTISENPLLNTCLSAMLKEGTTQRSSAQIADEVDFYGAYLMPEYSYDQTSLTLYTLNKHAVQVLPILQDVLTNSIIPEEELQTYIRNNKQSLQISLQKNDFLARRLFYNNLFGATRYGITPTMESYASISRDDLMALYKAQIQPSNCTLILSGNVDAEILAQVEQLFVQQWPQANVDPALSAPVLPDFKPQFIMEEKADALQSAIRIGMPFVNRKHPDFPAIQFVNTLFGGYFGSRLMSNIREDKGYTYSIGSAVASLKHGGFFTIASEVGVDVTQATLDEIEHEFQQLCSQLPSAEEVDLVRNYILGSQLGSLESIFSHADKFKSVYFYGMDLDYYAQYTQVMRTMTPERVLAIAQQYFTYANLLIVVVGKFKAD